MKQLTIILAALALRLAALLGTGAASAANLDFDSLETMKIDDFQSSHIDDGSPIVGLSETLAEIGALY